MNGSIFNTLETSVYVYLSDGCNKYTYKIINNSMEKKLFFSKLFNEYDQIAVFVQKQNDLDTCCCACAIAELVSHNYSNKTISILGLYGTSKFLPENKKYKNKPID